MSTETARKPTVLYTVEDGRIFRDGGGEKEQVAKYDPRSGIVELLPEKASYRPAIIRHINDKGHKYTEVGKIGMDLDLKDLPKKPKMNPRLGDKTPEVIEWYAQHQKEVFLERYGVRELQVRTGFETVERKIRDEEGKLISIQEKIPQYRTVEGFGYSIQALLTGEQRLIADRQSHITHKVREQNTDDGIDWDLDKPKD